MFARLFTLDSIRFDYSISTVSQSLNPTSSLCLSVIQNESNIIPHRHATITRHFWTPGIKNDSCRTKTSKGIITQVTAGSLAPSIYYYYCTWCVVSSKKKKLLLIIRISTAKKNCAGFRSKLQHVFSAHASKPRPEFETPQSRNSPHRLMSRRDI